MRLPAGAGCAGSPPPASCAALSQCSPAPSGKETPVLGSLGGLGLGRGP